MESVETLNDSLKGFFEVENGYVFGREVSLNVVQRYLRLSVTIVLKAEICLRANLYDLSLLESFDLLLIDFVLDFFLIHIVHHVKILIPVRSDPSWVVPDGIFFRVFSIYEERLLNLMVFIDVEVITSLHNRIKFKDFYKTLRIYFWEFIAILTISLLPNSEANIYLFNFNYKSIQLFILIFSINNLSLSLRQLISFLHIL